MRLGEGEVIEDIQVVSTGSLGARHRAGRRRPAARPRGRDLRPGVLGQDHARPCRSIAEMQKQGGICAFVDAEHALDIAVRPKARRQPATTC